MHIFLFLKMLIRYRLLFVKTLWSYRGSYHGNGRKRLRIKLEKSLLISLAVFVAVFAMNPGTANAAPMSAAADYHAEYSATNIYTGDQLLIYYFTGLDPDANYIWLLQGTDESGVGNQALSMKFFDGDGVTTTHSITFSAIDFDAQDGTAYTGSARLLDNYGQTQGVHYLMSGCVLDSYPWCAGTEWGEAGGVNGSNNRVVIGKRAFSNPRSVEGYFHPTDNPSVVTVEKGNYTFLHYRYDPAIVPTNEIYQIYDISDTVLLYQFYLDDLYKYNDDIRRVTLGDSTQTWSFVVLSTNGVIPDFINHDQDAAAWTIGDNPHEASFDYGAYDYERTDAGGANIDDGESFFLVSRGAPQEWVVTGAQAGVGATNNLRLELQSKTTEIWDDGYLNHEFVDTQQGNVDSDNYVYIPRRTFFYEVGAVEGSNTASWYIYPTVSNLTDTGLNLAHRKFVFDYDYNITAAMAIGDRFEDTLNGFGFDTPLGRGLAMLLVMAVAMLFIAKKGAKGFVAFALTFLFIGGAWIAIGLGDALTTMLFGVCAIIIIFLLIQNRRKDEGFG